ncbi:TorF family putative porin [Alteromonas flava]|uniref:TorF family putative porin n=1 Tax=Alteromonas flava TaxID=2048003 RepID=UPI000C295144|nr:TorF family putative porin [Alteromonas flava]
MKSTTIIAGLIALSPLTAHSAPSFTVGIASDYVFRGISQTDSNPALQASVDFESESGWYGGIWGSNVDFNDDANTEIDYYLGYAHEFEHVLLDIGFNYYSYQGYSSSDDSDYGELLVNAEISNFSLLFGYTNDYINSDESVSYLSAAYLIPLANEFSLTLQVGYSRGEEALGENYVDYSATVEKSWHGIDASLALHSTDIDDSDIADTRLVLLLAKTF